MVWLLLILKGELNDAESHIFLLSLSFLPKVSEPLLRVKTRGNLTKLGMHYVHNYPGEDSECKHKLEG